MEEVSDMNPLGLDAVQGCAVTAVGVSVNNASGAFKDPLALDPAVISLFAHAEVGDTIYGIVRMDVVSFGYKPVPHNEDQLKYVPVLRCTDATPIDSELGAELINQQRDVIRTARKGNTATPRPPHALHVVEQPKEAYDDGQG